MIPDSYRSNFRPFYLQPPYALLSFCSLSLPAIGRGIVAPPLRDGFRSWLRHTEAGSPMHLGRIEFNIVLFTDWSFASGCSPPRFSTTQLPSATDRPVFPSGRDFHPSVGAYFQAHLTQALRARLRSACPSGTKAICPSKTRIKLAFMPLRPGAWQRRGGRREEKNRTQARRLLPLPWRHASLRSSALGVSYLLETSKLQVSDLVRYLSSLLAR